VFAFLHSQGVRSGSGEGSELVLRFRECSERFSLAVGWFLAAPVCGAALPSAGCRPG
jgi:hypothetical protein